MKVAPYTLADEVIDLLAALPVDPVVARRALCHVRAYKALLASNAATCDLSDLADLVEAHQQALCDLLRELVDYGTVKGGAV